MCYIKAKYIKEFIKERYGFVPVDEIILTEDSGQSNDIGVIYVSVKGKLQDVMSIAWSEYAAFLEDKIEKLENN